MGPLRDRGDDAARLSDPEDPHDERRAEAVFVRFAMVPVLPMFLALMPPLMIDDRLVNYKANERWLALPEDAYG